MPILYDLDFGFPECVVLCQTDHYSLAGEFFPEAAQIAYKMWELSAMTKVQVWTLSALEVCACLAWHWHAS